MVNVVGILEPVGKPFGDGIYKKKVDKHPQIVNLNIILIDVKGIQKDMVEDELIEKKMEVFTYQNIVADVILTGKEIVELDANLVVDMDMVAGTAVTIYGIVEGIIEEVRVRI